MCRFAAYIGHPIAIEQIVILPQHSLLEQSQNATEAKLAVNGDGFGLAWYNENPEDRAGLYRDVLPAWSDGNLPDLCRMIKSGLFLAHVRASTVGETARVNCHPFRNGKWTFMHNGQIGNFNNIKRQLESELPERLYHARRGSTDSEMLFLTMLANGLQDNPIEAVNHTMARINALQKSDAQPNRITCAFSDGQSIYAFRHSSDNHSPTLYIGKDAQLGGTILASEPLDSDAKNWRAINENEIITVNNKTVTSKQLTIALKGQNSQ